VQGERLWKVHYDPHNISGVIRVLLTAIIALGEKGSADRDGFEGVGLAEWNLVPEHQVGFSVSFCPPRFLAHTGA